MSEEEIDFFKIASEVCKEKGKVYEFECPICKNKASAIRSTLNGHLHAKCDKCDIWVME